MRTMPFLRMTRQDSQSGLTEGRTLIDVGRIRGGKNKRSLFDAGLSAGKGAGMFYRSPHPRKVVFGVFSQCLSSGGGDPTRAHLRAARQHWRTVNQGPDSGRARETLVSPPL